MNDEHRMRKLLEYARECAADGPADRHTDASRSWNRLVQLALALAGETPEMYSKLWNTPPTTGDDE